MGLEKSIEHGKEHRKGYTKAKAVAKSCRNHGSCIWCEGNRKHRSLKEFARTDSQIKEYERKIWTEEYE